MGRCMVTTWPKLIKPAQTSFTKSCYKFEHAQKAKFLNLVRKSYCPLNFYLLKNSFAFFPTFFFC